MITERYVQGFLHYQNWQSLPDLQDRVLKDLHLDEPSGHPVRYFVDMVRGMRAQKQVADHLVRLEEEGRAESQPGDVIYNFFRPRQPPIVVYRTDTVEFRRSTDPGDIQLYFPETSNNAPGLECVA